MMSLTLSSPLVRPVRAGAPRRAQRASARRVQPARAGSVEIVRDDEPRRLSGDSAVSEGLAISGAVMALNGGVGSFTVRDDVNVTRSEEGGRTTVTIKVGSRNWSGAQSSVASTYLLPTVGPLPDAEEARRKQAELEAALRKAKEEEEEAERRRKALEAQSKSTGGFGTRVPLSDAALAALAAEGQMAWAKDGAGGDSTYSYYNIYRTGEAKEAVEATADAAFSALAIWLSEQQTIVEKQFYMERDRLKRIYEEEKAQALAALREQLDKEFQAKLAEELNRLKYQMEVEKQQAIEKLRAEAVAAQAAALAKQEAELTAKAEAAMAALRSMYESQVSSLQQQLAALEEKRKKDIEDVRAAAAAEKKAALAQQKKELLSKYEVVRIELVKAQELSIDGALARIDEICKELRVFYEQNINNEIA